MEIILDQNVCGWSWDSFGMYTSLASWKALRHQGHYWPLGLLWGSTNSMDRLELNKPQNIVLTTDAPRKLAGHSMPKTQWQGLALNPGKHCVNIRDNFLRWVSSPVCKFLVQPSLVCTEIVGRWPENTIRYWVAWFSAPAPEGHITSVSSTEK